MTKYKIVVPWHNPEQIEAWKDAWGVTENHPDLILQQDTDKSGCAVTKNRGIQKAIEQGADWVVVLDDDCLPSMEAQVLEELCQNHWLELQPQDVEMFQTVTDPPSRGTPYFNRTLKMEVAASMGFWEHVGDYDAPGQLVHGARKPMTFKQEVIYGKYFPLCGMNLAFRVKWWPWCQFIDVSRFDDIWQGFIWQKKAYAEGCCFNLRGPIVRHSRQSNVWANLRDEAKYLEANEMVWSVIAASSSSDYEELRKLLPV